MHSASGFAPESLATHRCAAASNSSMSSAAKPHFSRSLFWFRRDLRAFDNAGLFAALEASEAVYAVFVFDREILDALDDPADRRVEFIWESVAELKAALLELGCQLHVLHDHAVEAIPSLASQLKVDAVFTNHDYEPGAVVRDDKVAAKLQQAGIAFETRKDHVVFEKDEVLTQGGKFFSVFTPYKNAWLKKIDASRVAPFDVASLAGRFSANNALDALIPLEKMGFKRTNLSELKFPVGARGGELLFEQFLERIDRYDDARNFPAIKGPSYLSTHLRFGTVSIRALVRAAWTRWQEGSRGAEIWLSELIWRDFYAHILHHNPRVVGKSFKPEYDQIQWRNDTTEFTAWCDGRTGYPIVDAAMRQLNQTGYMHNRLRMVAASFLVKDLLIDWRWGEAYFAKKLNDFDLASNNGGWQWAASTGCDAQPYFRIFNPLSQSEKFDAEGVFIRKYVPEVATLSNKDIHAPWLTSPIEQKARGFVPGRDYPLPIVDHAKARESTLAEFKRALK